MLASRRGFLVGRFRKPSVPSFRPPWAVTEAEFVRRCNGCASCVEACPSHILKIDADGLATVDFNNGECTFCGDCATACEPAALMRADPEGAAPWRHKVGIGADCLARKNVECRVCGESCATGAIRFRPRLGGAALPQTESECCSGCGACIAPCPAGAIVMEVQQ